MDVGNSLTVADMLNPKSHLFQINNITEEAEYRRPYKAEEINFSRGGIRGSF